LESRSFWLDTIPLLKNKAASRAATAQRPRNDRAVSGAVSAVVSAQHLVNHPGNSRDMSRQLAGNISPSAGECPRQSSPQSWHDGWQMTSQLPPQSAQHPAWRPTQHPRNFRATSETCPGSWREASHKTPMKVRAKVCTIVGTMVRK